jgi:hypothetical protein
MFTGCQGPSAANIDLRKQIQQLQSKVDQLTITHQRDEAALAACQRGHPNEPTLSPDRLAKLFTSHGLQFGRLTGGDNPDPTQPSDSRLMVYIAPTDEQGTPIKAAGVFKVEAFDLADPQKPLIGTWMFSLEQSRDLFYSRLVEYEYALPCPWQTIPQHANLTVRVTFDDALTGREFVSQMQVRIRPPK